MLVNHHQQQHVCTRQDKHPKVQVGSQRCWPPPTTNLQRLAECLLSNGLFVLLCRELAQDHELCCHARVLCAQLHLQQRERLLRQALGLCGPTSLPQHLHMTNAHVDNNNSPWCCVSADNKLTRTNWACSATPSSGQAKTHQPAATTQHAYLRQLVLPEGHLHIRRPVCCPTDAQRSLADVLRLCILPAAAQQLNLQLQDCEQLRARAAVQWLLHRGMPGSHSTRQVSTHMLRKLPRSACSSEGGQACACCARVCVP